MNRDEEGLLPLPTPELIEPLNHEEQAELAECEDVIERGQRSFIEVGQALIKVREGIGNGPLYRETHGTFETYVKERWQMGLRNAEQLMIGAKVTAVLSEARRGAPSIERAVRPLTTLRTDDGELDEELIQEAWEKAQEIAEAVSRPHEEGPHWKRQVVTKSRLIGPTPADVRKAVRLIKGEEEVKRESMGGKPKPTEAELHFEAAMEELQWLTFNGEWELVDRAFGYLNRELQKRAS